ncbi:ATP-dependent metallopeptidase FtsH/Yme1/Tma family protein, partial [Acaryochloris marina NIES-2412]
MPIKDKPQRPRPNLITSLLLFLPAILLIANLALPYVMGPRVPRVPYSFFIEQVRDEQVARVSVGQKLIRYKLKEGVAEQA